MAAFVRSWGDGDGVAGLGVLYGAIDFLICVWGEGFGLCLMGEKEAGYEDES